MQEDLHMNIAAGEIFGLRGLTLAHGESQALKIKYLSIPSHLPISPMAHSCRDTVIQCTWTP